MRGSMVSTFSRNLVSSSCGHGPPQRGEIETGLTDSVHHGHLFHHHGLLPDPVTCTFLLSRKRGSATVITFCVQTSGVSRTKGDSKV